MGFFFHFFFFLRGWVYFFFFFWGEPSGGGIKGFLIFFPNFLGKKKPPGNCSFGGGGRKPPLELDAGFLFWGNFFFFHFCFFKRGVFSGLRGFIFGGLLYSRWVLGYFLNAKKRGEENFCLGLGGFFFFEKFFFNLWGGFVGGLNKGGGGTLVFFREKGFLTVGLFWGYRGGGTPG